jgi:GNAT superfamily N-acetyltransferase
MNEALLSELDLNYRVASAQTFACSDVGEALETREVHIVTCGYPVAEFNWAFLKLPSARFERGIERAEHYFDGRELPFRFIVRSDLADGTVASSLEARGYAPVAKKTPGMALAPLRTGPGVPTGLEIRRVADDDQLAAFQHTAFRGFGIPVQFGEAFLTDDLLRSPNSALFVGYVGSEPVATSILLATGKVAGIYWVATIEGFRRRGYAEALTWAALEAGLERGCRLGSLQASEMGRPVYERMGFEQTASYTNFERLLPGSES